MQNLHDNDTIAALATAAGMGAIAVLRLSGPKAVAIADKVFEGPKGKKLSGQSKNTAHFGRITDRGELVDEVVATLFLAPQSYTGEDVVEISCHGSVYIQRRLLHLLLTAGARMAEPGEFTQRAFLNGKMDLSQAEAVGDLIASENEASARVALLQMRGGFAKELVGIRTALIDFAALIELELDFSEEDVEFADRTALISLLNQAATILKRLSDSFAVGNVIRNGIPVVIVGAPNAGKSTLLNALLNEERAIVSDIAGTTRDTIEDTLHLGGLTFRFIDTAGLRQTSDAIETIGIRKALEKVAEASVVLYLYDALRPPADLEGQYRELLAHAGKKTIITVANKCDKAPAVCPIWVEGKFLSISALGGSGMEDLKSSLLSVVETDMLSNNQVVVTNARHFQNLNLALDAIGRVKEGVEIGRSGELLALDMREALRGIGNITGEIELDRDVLGSVFSKFCIGK